MTKTNIVLVSRNYENFMKYLFIVLNQFPRSQKHLMRFKIMEYAFNAWDNLKQAEYYDNKDYKIKYIQKVFHELFMLSNSLRLSADLGFLGLVSNQVMSKEEKANTKFNNRYASDSECLNYNEVKAKNSQMAYFKLTRQLGEIKNDLDVVLKELKNAKI